ncbi:MAG: hypothetical protein AAFQ94_31125 [Bacteroidota bacterium]
MKNIDLIYQNTPVVSSIYYSLNENNQITKYEDIHIEEFVAVFNNHNYLLFKSSLTWHKGLFSRRLIGSPKKASSIKNANSPQFEPVQVDISQAFEKAFDILKKDGLGTAFTSHITLFRESFDSVEEPFYQFTTDANQTIRVGAYSGEAKALATLIAA